MKNAATPEDDDIKHRKSLRLKDFDYTTPGGYFTTLSPSFRISRFGMKVLWDL